MKPVNPTPPDPLETLKALLWELSLSSLARLLPDILQKAEQESPGYSDFLRAALSLEKNARTSRRIQSRLRASHLGVGPSDLNSFDFSVRPQLSAKSVRELLNCLFVAEKRNLIIIGRPSTGKTSVGRIIGRAACLLGYSVYATSMADMLAELYAARADGTYRKALRRLTQPDLLIIDDAGFSALSPDNATELFRLVSARYQQRSMIVVTNLPFRMWGEFIPSPAQAVAIADRLMDNATVLRFSGKPFRRPKEILGAPLEEEEEDTGNKEHAKP